VEYVARRVRAWIETLRNQLRQEFDVVARRVRAWIETLSAHSSRSFSASPAVCGRGLKQKLVLDALTGIVVARRVRAWIETVCEAICSADCTRRPPCAGVD